MKDVTERFVMWQTQGLFFLLFKLTSPCDLISDNWAFLQVVNWYVYFFACCWNTATSGERETQAEGNFCSLMHMDSGMLWGQTVRSAAGGCWAKSGLFISGPTNFPHRGERGGWTRLVTLDSGAWQKYSLTCFSKWPEKLHADQSFKC